MSATMSPATKLVTAASLPQRIELKEQFTVDVRALHEGKGGGITELPDGRFRVRAKMQHCGIVNRNRRIYPAETTWGKHTIPESTFARRVKSRRVTGQLEHPENGRSSMSLGAIVITEVEQPDKDGAVYGTFETMSTPPGKIVESYIRDGVTFGLSSRGNGSVIRNADGVDEVQPDFEPVTVDCVLDESTPGAEVLAGKLKESMSATVKMLLETTGGDQAAAEKYAVAQTEAAVFRDVLSGEQKRAAKAAPLVPPAGLNKYVGAPADGAGHYRAYQVEGRWDLWFHPLEAPAAQIATGLQTFNDTKPAVESHRAWCAEGACQAEAYGVAGAMPYSGTTIFLYPFDSPTDAEKSCKALEKAGFYVDHDGDALAVQTAYADPAQGVAHIKRVLVDIGITMADERVGYSVTRDGKAVLQDNVPAKFRTIEAINNLLGTVYDMPATTVPQEDGSDPEDGDGDQPRLRAMYGDEDEGGVHLTIINVFSDHDDTDQDSEEESTMGMKEPAPVTIQAPMPEMDLPVPGKEEMGAGNNADSSPPDLHAQTTRGEGADGKKPVGPGRPGGYPDGGQAMPDTEYAERGGKGGDGEPPEHDGHGDDDGKDHSADDTEIRADDPVDDKGNPQKKPGEEDEADYTETNRRMAKAATEYFEQRAKLEKMKKERRMAAAEQVANPGTCCGQKHEHTTACAKAPTLAEEGSGYGKPEALDDPEDLDLDLDWVTPPDEGPDAIDLNYMEAVGPANRRARKVKLSPVALSVFEVLRASSRPLSKSDITGLLVIPDNMWVRALHELHGAGLVGTVGIGPGTRYRAIYDAPSEGVEGLIADSVEDKPIDPAIARTLPEYYATAPRPLVDGKRPEGALRLYFNESDQLIEVQEFDASGALVSRTGSFRRIDDSRFQERFEALIAEMKKKAKKDKKDDKDDEKAKKDKTDEAKKPKDKDDADAKKKAKAKEDEKAKKDKAKADESKKDDKDDEKAKKDKKKKDDEKKAKKNEAARTALATVTDAMSKGGMKAAREVVREATLHAVIAAEDADELSSKRQRYLQDEVARLEAENAELTELLQAVTEQQRAIQVETRLTELVKAHPELAKLRARLSRCESVDELNQEATDLLVAIRESRAAPRAATPSASQVESKSNSTKTIERTTPAPTLAPSTKTSVTSLDVQAPPKGALAEGDNSLTPSLSNSRPSPASGDTSPSRTAAYRRRARG